MMVPFSAYKTIKSFYTGKVAKYTRGVLKYESGIMCHGRFKMCVGLGSWGAAPR